MQKKNQHVYHAVSLGIYTMSLSVVIPYLIILISQEQYVGFFDLTFQQWLVIIPTVLISIRFVVGFFQHGYVHLIEQMDKAIVGIAKTFLIFTSAMMFVGIAEFFGGLTRAQVDWITYPIFYGFLSQVFYFAFVSLPIIFWIEPYRKK